MGFTYPGYRTNFRANNFGLQLVPHNNAMEDWKLLLTADQKRERRIQSQNSFYITYRERPLMTSHIRVGRGVQNSPKKGRYRVGQGR